MLCERPYPFSVCIDWGVDDNVQLQYSNDLVGFRCFILFLLRCLGKIQTEDGHWAGDYGGPMFLLPGYAIVMHVTNTPIPDTHKLEIIRYLSNTQSPDGGYVNH